MCDGSLTLVNLNGKQVFNTERHEGKLMIFIQLQMGDTSGSHHTFKFSKRSAKTEIDNNCDL